jgi:hypothetical protein
VGVSTMLIRVLVQRGGRRLEPGLTGIPA